MNSATKLKRVVVTRAGGTPPVDDPAMWDEHGMPWVSIGDMTKAPTVVSAERRVSPIGIAAKSLPVGKPGTLLFAMYASIGAVAVLGMEASWNQAILGIEPREGLSEARFVRYWLEHLKPDLLALSRSNTQHNLNAEQVGNLPFPTRDPSMQAAIADYLDFHTQRLDALAAAKRLMLELLEERWQTVIYDAAAGRLLGADVPRRRASVPWLTDVPAHWREGQLKLIARLGTGHTPSRSRDEWWVNPTISWVTTGDVVQMRSDRIEHITDTRERISEHGLNNSAAVLHPAGTVVLCRTASAGYSAIMGREMATSQDFATWTCGPLMRPRFLLLCLRAMRRDLLGRLAMGSTHKTIYMPDIESIRVPIPPLKEQDRLVAGASSEQRMLNEASTRLARQIQLLHERRRVLVSAAVTGELEIPEAA
jgi:type I restriction enzyme S subunit